MHARAVERENILKQRVCELEERRARQEERIRELLGANEKLPARAAWLETQLFGRKSERTKGEAGEPADDAPDISKTAAAAGEEPKRRGGRPGAKGHGRRRHTHLPTEEIRHELPQDRQCCPCCGRPFEVFPGTEDSDELDWDVSYMSQSCFLFFRLSLTIFVSARSLKGDEAANLLRLSRAKPNCCILFFVMASSMIVKTRKKLSFRSSKDFLRYSKAFRPAD